MLTVKIVGHEYYYGLSDIIRLFWNGISENRDEHTITCEDCVFDLTILSILGEDSKVETRVCFNQNSKDNFSYSDKFDLEELDFKRELKRQLYLVLSDITNKSFPWGCLTGIRPTIIAGETKNQDDMSKQYLVRPDKAELAYEVKNNEDRILDLINKDSLNIYVGIPFCPSRCEYCSFVSQDIGHHIGRLEEYEKALCQEIQTIGARINREVRSLYIGGGTPTVFEDKLFEHLLRTTFESLPVDKNTEVTIEAGRPDTITEYKLDVIKDLGVQRICINPQTMNSDTLRKLNRKHSAEDVYEIYNLSKAKSIDIVNMDLIAGLKYEEPDELIRSLNKVIDLNPANVTIHTLYKKRRASMSREDITERLREDDALDRAVSQAYEILRENEYIPYYMYRQKDTGHGLENVGFARKGTECIYNVAMMTDGRDVLSFGAGGMSKRIFEETSPGKFRLERHSCVKDVLLYMQKIEEISEGKIEFFGL